MPQHHLHCNTEWNTKKKNAIKFFSPKKKRVPNASRLIIGFNKLSIITFLLLAAHHMILLQQSHNYAYFSRGLIHAEFTQEPPQWSSLAVQTARSIAFKNRISTPATQRASLLLPVCSNGVSSVWLWCHCQAQNELYQDKTNCILFMIKDK